MTRKPRKNLYRWRVLVYQGAEESSWGSVADRITHEDAHDLAAMLNRKRTPKMLEHEIVFRVSDSEEPAALYVERRYILDFVEHHLDGLYPLRPYPYNG